MKPQGRIFYGQAQILPTPQPAASSARDTRPVAAASGRDTRPVAAASGRDTTPVARPGRGHRPLLLNQAGMAIGREPTEPECPMSGQSMEYPAIRGEQLRLGQLPFRARSILNRAVTVPAGERQCLRLIDAVRTG